MIVVKYVDGEEITITPEGWPDVPGHGVDWIEVRYGDETTRVTGHSIYWLYREDQAWVVGGGPVGYEHPLSELVFAGGGQTERRITHMPDLPYSAVKLGHWWPGSF